VDGSASADSSVRCSEWCARLLDGAGDVEGQLYLPRLAAEVLHCLDGYAVTTVTVGGGSGSGATRAFAPASAGTGAGPLPAYVQWLGERLEACCATEFVVLSLDRWAALASQLESLLLGGQLQRPRRPRSVSMDGPPRLDRDNGLGLGDSGRRLTTGPMARRTSLGDRTMAEVSDEEDNDNDDALSGVLSGGLSTPALSGIVGSRSPARMTSDSDLLSRGRHGHSASFASDLRDSVERSSSMASSDCFTGVLYKRLYMGRWDRRTFKLEVCVLP
jgi:hypothetical protein